VPTSESFGLESLLNLRRATFEDLAWAAVAEASAQNGPKCSRVRVRRCDWIRSECRPNEPA